MSSKAIKRDCCKTGKKHYPIKTYCYYPLTESLHAILTRPLYLEKCELWRKREIPFNLLGDIYEGQVWKDFQVYKEQPFLSQPYNIALMMNCDWFQPYDHSQ